MKTSLRSPGHANIKVRAARAVASLPIALCALLLAAPAMAQMRMPAAASSSADAHGSGMHVPAKRPPSSASTRNGPKHSAAKPAHAMQGADHGAAGPMQDHQGMKGMTMPAQRDSASPPVGSLPSSDGAAPKSYDAYGITLHMPNDPLISKFLLDNLEYANGRDGVSQGWELKAWTGHNLNRLWLRSEGERSDGRVDDADAELLWGHAIGTFWDLMLGARHDFGQGMPTRNWAAFGVQGLAPYQFDFESTIYLGPAGRSAFRLRTTQEWLFTQRLILEPEFEFNAYGRADPRRHLGAGISDASLSLRLRYEFSRKFAPYIGYAWIRKFGVTADMARDEGAPVLDRQWLLGVRIWL